MSEGYVYILTNDAMPGLIKIGMTTGLPEARAAQLQTTGVPLPFSVAHSVYSPDCASLEADVHQSLPDARVSGSREFFKHDVSEAIKLLDHLHLEQVYEHTSKFTESHVLVHELAFVDPSFLEVIALLIDRGAYEVPQILGEARCDDDGVDLAELARRYDARIERRKASRAQVIALKEPNFPKPGALQ